MPIRPKVYTATVEFHSGGRHFMPGDEVDGPVLRNVLRFGDMFVSAATTPVAKKEVSDG